MGTINKICSVANASINKVTSVLKTNIKYVAGQVVDATYQSQKGLRFDGSAYLSRTPGSAGNRRTWTYSCWIKRSANTGVEMSIIRAHHSSYGAKISFLVNDKLNFVNQGSGTLFNVTTDMVFRDYTAWYHIVVAVDTTQSQTADRIKIYVNGSQVTYTTGTAPQQNNDTEMNYTTPHYIGAWDASNDRFSGYMDDFCLIDGLQLNPTSFGETNSLTGAWQPKSLSALTRGTCGSWLDFEDNSTTTALGYDNGTGTNDWSTTGFSVTTGYTNDSLSDNNTNNYCTLNPLDKHVSGVVSNGLLEAGSTDGAGYFVGSCGTTWVTSGKWYWEATPIAGSYWLIGITQEDISRIVSGVNFGPGSGSNSVGWYYNGNTYQNGGLIGWVSAYALNDVIGVAFDADSGKVWFSKNGTWQASGNPATGANPAYINATGRAFAPCTAAQFSAAVIAHNFGQRTFAYTPPTGFLALCSKNITDSAVAKASQYVAAVPYTGA